MTPPKGTTSPGEAKGREVWVREDSRGVPQQSALWEHRAKPNHIQREMGHRVVRYVPEQSAQREPAEMERRHLAKAECFVTGDTEAIAQALAEAESRGAAEAADVEALLQAARWVLDANTNVPPVGLSRDQVEHDAMRALVAAVNRFPHPCAAAERKP